MRSAPLRHSVPSGSWSHFTYFLSFRHAAVGDLNADRIVVQVVVYPRHTTPRIQNYEKKGFVPKKRSSNISHFCKQLHFCHLTPSKETLLTFVLWRRSFRCVVCESKCVGMLRCALLDDHLFAVSDIHPLHGRCLQPPALEVVGVVGIGRGGGVAASLTATVPPSYSPRARRSSLSKTTSPSLT